MSVKVSCPECGTTLRSSKPIPAGKQIKCPKCAQIFRIGNDAASAADDIDQAARKGRGQAAAGARGRTEPDAAGRTPEGEDDEIATYGLADGGFVEDGEKVSYKLDTSIRDPRGPASAAVVKPSNILILAGMLSAIFFLYVFGDSIWPFVFVPEAGHYIVDYEQVLLRNNAIKGKPPRTVEDAVSNPQYKQLLDQAESEEKKWRIIRAVLALLQVAYSLVVAMGAVKMQNLESYYWAMTAAVMGISPMTLTFPGILAINALVRPEVKIGFFFKPDV
jgi:hypothetical protein